MLKLIDMDCEPCKLNSEVMTKKEVSEYLTHLALWKVNNLDSVEQLQRSFEFKDFKQAIKFTNYVGELAEAHKHHPSIITEWGYVRVSWWTHKIKGLHKNDFILAAKTDLIFELKFGQVLANI